MVGGAVEIKHGGLGRFRLVALGDFSAKSLHVFLHTAVAEGTTLETDSWLGHSGGAGVSHNPLVVDPVATDAVLP